MTDTHFDVIVIGSGPGGYIGAIKAAQNGKKVAMVERSAHLGGTCLNVGCIPTKALLQSAKSWDKLKSLAKLGIEVKGSSYNWTKTQDFKDGIVDGQRKGVQFLMKKNKITVFKGHGKLKGGDAVEVSGDKTQTIHGKAIMIATGSKVRELPFAPSNGKGIMTSDHILSIDAIPKSLVVVGGGVVGMEFASLFARIGTDVTVVEMAKQIFPYEDGEVVKEATKLFKKQGITMKTGSQLEGVEDKGGSCVVKIKGQDSLTVEKVLMSIGRAPVTDNLGLDNVGIALDERGFIPVDEHYRTKAPHVYAIGDVIDTPALAHTASAEAIYAADMMSGKNPPAINYDANPSAIYSWPEVASIGKTEEALKAEGIAYKSAKFPFSVIVKAKIEGGDIGFIKVLFEPKYREILGVHIVGATATEMIAEFSLGKVLETTIDEIAQTIHPHPTVSEAAAEVAHLAMGHALNM